MRFFTIKDGKKAVSDHLPEPWLMERVDWRQLFTELGFEVENQMDLNPERFGEGAFLDNYFHTGDYDLQLEHLHKVEGHLIWAVKSKERGRRKNKDLVNAHNIKIGMNDTSEDFETQLNLLLETMRSQYEST